MGAWVGGCRGTYDPWAANSSPLVGSHELQGASEVVRVKKLRWPKLRWPKIGEWLNKFSKWWSPNEAVFMESLKMMSLKRFLMLWEINCIIICNINWKTDVKCFIQVDPKDVKINMRKPVIVVVYIT